MRFFLATLRVKGVVRCLLLFFLFSLAWSDSRSQSTDNFTSKIIPVSPEAATIAKYVNFPISYSTGMPQIDVPLFEIKCGDITLPITLNFHGGGVKGYEKPGWLGYGWSLSCELGTTKVTHGSQYAQRDWSPSSGGVTFSEKMGLLNGSIVGEPDEIYYKLIGKSGRVSSGPYGLMHQPFDPLVDVSFEEANYNGLSYTFGVGEITHNSGSLNEDQLTAKKCTRIGSLKGDVITFSYQNANSPATTSYNSKIEVYDDATFYCSNGSTFINEGTMITQEGTFYSTTFCGRFYPTSDTYQSSYDPRYPVYMIDKPRVYVYSSSLGDNGLYLASNEKDETGQYQFKLEKQESFPYTTASFTTSSVEMKKIDQINFCNGRAKFFLRESNGQKQNLLDSIVIYNSFNVVIKVIRFYYRFDGYLEKVSVGNTGEVLENYNFEYGSGMYSNGKRKTINFRNNAWINHIPAEGNFNGEIGNTYDVDWASQNYYQSPVITKITYPGGGYTSFDYEVNKYFNSTTQSVEDAWGWRIASVKHYDGIAAVAAFEKHYTYGETENGAGYRLYDDDPFRYSYEQTVYHCSPLFVLSAENSSAETLPLITERKRTYYALPLDNAVLTASAPVMYTSVTEYQKDMGTQTGKTTYTYNLPLPNPPFLATYWMPNSPVSFDMNLQVDDMTSQVKYAWKNGQYQWVEKTAFQKDTFYSPSVYLWKAHNFIEADGTDFGSWPGPTTDPTTLNNQGLMLFTWPLYGEVRLPKTETVTTRNLDEPLVELKTEKHYFYDNPLHLKATRIETKNSTGKSLLTYHSYPLDYPVAGRPYGINSNPIETVKVLQDGSNTKILSGQITTFKSTGSPSMVDKVYNLENFAPVDLSSFKFSNRGQGLLPVGGTATAFNMDPNYKEKLSFDKYDVRGNPLEVIPKDNVPVCYFWGYNGLYPVAKVVGSDYNTAKQFINQAVLDNPATTDAQMRAELQKLRINLPGKQVTTYTYAPLIGITSQTDAGNHTTFYEYDSFSRLKHIRDQDGNILKAFNYKYQEQQ